MDLTFAAPGFQKNHCTCHILDSIKPDFLSQIAGDLFVYFELLPPVGPENSRTISCGSFGSRECRDNIRRCIAAADNQAGLPDKLRVKPSRR